MSNDLVVRPETSVSSWLRDSLTYGCLETAANVAGLTGGGAIILAMGAAIAFFVGMSMPFSLPVCLLAASCVGCMVWIGGEIYFENAINKVVEELCNGTMSKDDFLAFLEKQQMTLLEFHKFVLRHDLNPLRWTRMSGTIFSFSDYQK